MSPHWENLRKSSMEECAFGYIVLYIVSLFNKNSLLQSCFLSFLLIGNTHYLYLFSLRMSSISVSNSTGVVWLPWQTQELTTTPASSSSRWIVPMNCRRNTPSSERFCLKKSLRRRAKRSFCFCTALSLV